MNTYIILSRYGNSQLVTTVIDCNKLQFNKKGKIKELNADGITIKVSGYIREIKLDSDPKIIVYSNHNV